MDYDISWIYLLIFLAIPLARIIPRLLAKAGVGGGNDYRNAVRAAEVERGGEEEEKEEKYFRVERSDYSERRTTEPRPATKPKPAIEDKPKTRNSLVLGALNRGSKTFASLQKNTGLSSEELDSVLGDLEKKGMLKVVKRQGLFGTKTELYPTDKGFQAYYS